MMLRDKYGATIEERFEKMASGLEVDAVALWSLVSKGWHGFGLREDALTDFVRRGVIALLESGAKPVIGVWRIATADSPILVRPGWPPPHDWQAVDYGETTRAIADAIVEEWLASGGLPHSDPRGLWFALPSFIRG